MKVIVKDISTCVTDGENSFDVLTLLDNQEHRFKMTVEIDRIGERELQVIKPDRDFDAIFARDLGIHRRICKLVSSIYNHQVIELPSNIGELADGRELALESYP